MAPELSKKRILVVEDDRSILDLLQELLEEEEYTVTTASNGQVALDLLHHSSELPDLILLDLMMPIKDGMQFRTEQIADPRLASIPVILLSADAQLDSKKEQMGLKYHIKKPFDVDVLVNTVKKVCA